MPLRRLASRWLLFAVSIPAAGLGLARSSHAAPLEFPVLETARSGHGPWYTSTRAVIRLRADVSRAAWSSLPRDRSATSLRAFRPSGLEALSGRLSGAWFEPEFRGTHPGMGSPDLSTFWIAHLPKGLDLSNVMDVLKASAEVEEAAPIAVVAVEDGAALEAASRTSESWGERVARAPLTAPAPSDSLWNLCYYLDQASRKDVHALEAWDITQGDPSVVMAIVDTGVLSYHPDLGGAVAGGHGNLWVNQAELHGLPGVDDDGNGFVDDVGGWDFVALDSAAEVRPGEDWNDADNDPDDFAVHGTAVAGVAGAIADNGIGIPGVAPRAAIMPLRAGYSSPLNAAGLIDLGNAAQAMVYAVMNGATVINCSFENVTQPDLFAAANFASAHHVVIVVAAGNNGTFNDLGTRDDVISVGATDQNDKVTLFSNPGAWVDLSAPGQSIPTTTLHPEGSDSIGLRTPGYSAGEAGTSFSAPMVTGAVALLQSARIQSGLPQLSPALVQLRLKESTDDISAQNPGNLYGTGRLNLYRLLADPAASTGIPVGARTVGAGVPLHSLSGRSLLAYVTAESTLILADPLLGQITTRLPLGSRPAGGIAAADFGPGAGTCLFVALADGRIVGFRFGSALASFWQVDATTSRGFNDLYPALGDLDGDGVPEVVWGGDDGSVWVWNLSGQRLPGFPRKIAQPGGNLRVALANLDGSPGLEIIAATPDYDVHLLGADGVERPGWPVYIGSTPFAPVVTRLGTDPAPVVVVGAGITLRGYRADGSLRFSGTLPSPLFEDIAVGDLDGDGRNEIVATTAAPYQVASFDSAGVMLREAVLTTPPDGAPVVGPLATDGGAQVMYASIDNQGRHQLLALSSVLAPLRNWPKAGFAAASPSLADVNGNGSTSVLAGSESDSTLYLYNAGQRTWRAASAGWPTARGNYARTGSQLGVPAIGSVDDQGPNSIGDLSAGAASTHDVTLRWTAPLDPGSSGPRAARYDVRVSTTPLDATNFAAAPALGGVPSPSAPGSAEQMTISTLTENADNWIALRGQDSDGNWGAISNVIDVRTQNDAPAAVADLSVQAVSDSTLTLDWTASGDDGRIGRPSYYRVRYSETPLDSAGFAAAKLGEDVPATATGGQREQHLLRGMPHGRRVWVAMRAVDAANNVSALSNQVAIFIGRLGGHSGVALIPSRQPSPAPVEIEWQGDPAYASSPQAIHIFDVAGREVRGLGLPNLPSGIAVWDGLNLNGIAMRSGIYFARLDSGPSHASTRIVLLR